MHREVAFPAKGPGFNFPQLNQSAINTGRCFSPLIPIGIVIGWKILKWTARLLCDFTA